MDEEGIARVCHEVNRAYCQSLGDFTQPPWERAPEWQRKSAVAGVRMIIAEPEAGPERVHEYWMAQKARDGWIYGPKKDPAERKHPGMAAFSDLPLEQQSKDFLFRAVVNALK